MFSTRLTEELKKDLMRKVDLYVNRSENERRKIMIFTHNIDEWVVERETCSIRVDVPPPIPPKYVPKEEYDIVDEMNAFMIEYCDRMKYKLSFCLSESGDENRPDVNIIFYERTLTPQDVIPLYRNLEGLEPSDFESFRCQDLTISSSAALAACAIKGAFRRKHRQTSTLQSEIKSSIFSLLASPESVPGTSQSPEKTPVTAPIIVYHRTSLSSSVDTARTPSSSKSSSSRRSADSEEGQVKCDSCFIPCSRKKED